jgi:hypothetical protein
VPNQQKRDKRITHRALVIPDTHAPLIDRAALDCVLQAIMLVRPNRIIHLGDVGEWEGANHHRFENVRKPEPSEIAHAIRKDVRAIRRTLLDPLDRICKEAGVENKDLTIGNHDIWPDRFVEANPDYANTIFTGASGYTFKQLFDWGARGWRLYPAGQLMQIGELRFYHGHLYGGIHHARTHLLKLGVNVIYGHHHSVKYDSVTHANGIKGAWCLGCLKRVDPASNQWLGNRITDWGHAFAVVDWYGSKGYFTVHMANIVEGKCSLLFEFLDGNQHVYV